MSEGGEYMEGPKINTSLMVISPERSSSGTLQETGKVERIEKWEGEEREAWAKKVEEQERNQSTISLEDRTRRIESISEEMRKVTGMDLGNYVLNKIKNSSLIKDDDARAIQEADKWLKMTGNGYFVDGVVQDEKRALVEEEEVVGRVPVVTDEMWRGKLPEKGRGGAQAGQLIQEPRVPAAEQESPRAGWQETIKDLFIGALTAEEIAEELGKIKSLFSRGGRVLSDSDNVELGEIKGTLDEILQRLDKEADQNPEALDRRNSIIERITGRSRSYAEIKADLSIALGMPDGPEKQKMIQSLKAERGILFLAGERIGLFDDAREILKQEEENYFRHISGLISDEEYKRYQDSKTRISSISGMNRGLSGYSPKMDGMLRDLADTTREYWAWAWGVSGGAAYEGRMKDTLDMMSLEQVYGQTLVAEAKRWREEARERKSEEERNRAAAAEAARRRDEAARPVPPVRSPEDGTNYTPEQVIKLVIEKFWDNPNVQIDQGALNRALGKMKENPEYADIVKLMEAVIEVHAFVPTATMSFKEYAEKIRSNLDTYKLLSFLDSSEKIEGISCVAEQWGVVVNPDGSYRIDASKLTRFKGLSTETKGQFYLEVRQKLAERLGKADAQDNTVWLAFIFGNAFLKMSGLSAELVDEIPGSQPGYFHPDVPKALWEARYPSRAIMERVKRSADSRSRVANADFVRARLNERGGYQIAGKPWQEMLTSPFRFHSLAFTTGALRSEEPLLVRVMSQRRKIDASEMVNAAVLAQSKRNAVVEKWFSQTMDMDEKSKSLLVTYKPLFRSSFAKDLTERAIREVDDFDDLTGDVAVDSQRISEVVGRQLLIGLGLDVSGNMNGQNPLTAEIIRTIFEGGIDYYDAKKDATYRINIDNVIAYIYSARREWGNTGNILVRKRDWYLSEALKRFRRNDQHGQDARSYVRDAAWGVFSAMEEANAYGNKYRKMWTDPDYYRDGTDLMMNIGMFNSKMFDS